MGLNGREKEGSKADETGEGLLGLGLFSRVLFLRVFGLLCLFGLFWLFRLFLLF